MARAALPGSDVSPFLDELARLGTLFTHAFVNTQGTAPSHTTILSGLYHETHEVGMTGVQNAR